MSHPEIGHDYSEETTGEIPDLKEADLQEADEAEVEKGLSYEDSVDREHDAELDRAKEREEHFAPTNGPENFGGGRAW